MQKLEYLREPSDTTIGHNYLVTVVDGLAVSCHCRDWLITMRMPKTDIYVCKHMLRVNAKQTM